MKDAFHRYVIEWRTRRREPCLKRNEGSRALRRRKLRPGKSWTLALPADGSQSRGRSRGIGANIFRRRFRRRVRERQKEADEFYAQRTGAGTDRGRAAGPTAGLCGSCSGASKAITTTCSAGSTAIRRSRSPIRAGAWGGITTGRSLYNSDVISMPDKWEYPWYAAWDLAFPLRGHGADRSRLRERPADSVSARMVHASQRGIARLRMEFLRRESARARLGGLARLQNRGARPGQAGSQVSRARVSQAAAEFHVVGESQGSAKARTFSRAAFSGSTTSACSTARSRSARGNFIEQSDGTSWMAMYCLDMLSMAMELAQRRLRLRRRGQQIFRAFRLHFDGDERHGRRGNRPVERTGRLLLRRAAYDRGAAHSHARALDGRADSALCRGNLRAGRLRRSSTGFSQRACNGFSTTTRTCATTST